MDNWDFALFIDDLQKAVKRFHEDKKSSRVETYLDFEKKEYRIIIEEVKLK